MIQVRRKIYNLRYFKKQKPLKKAVKMGLKTIFYLDSLLYTLVPTEDKDAISINI